MTHSEEHDQKRKATGADSGAWTTGSGDRSPKTDVDTSTNERQSATGSAQADDQRDPETGPRGTDQESNVPGRSKPASEPADTAPPNTTPGPHDT